MEKQILHIGRKNLEKLKNLKKLKLLKVKFQSLQ